MTPQEIIAELGQYEARISGILSRFRDYNMADPDTDVYSQLILETVDLLTDTLGANSYSANIMAFYNYGGRNYNGRTWPAAARRNSPTGCRAVQAGLRRENSFAYGNRESCR